MAEQSTMIRREDDLQVALAMASVGFYTSGIGAVLAGLATEFQVPAASLSWVGSTYGAGLLVVAVLGRFAFVRGPRLALLGSATVLALGSALSVFGTSLTSVFCGALLQGVSAAAVILIAPVMLTTDAAVRLTRVNAVSSLIGVSAPLLVGATMQFGLPGRYAQLALLPMLGWLIVLLARHLRADAASTLVNGARLQRPALGALARRWSTVFLAVSVEFSYVVWGVSRLASTGVDTGLAATLGIAFPVGMTVGRLAGPQLIRRLPTIPIAVALAATGTLTVVFADTWPLVATGLVLAGLGVATMYPVTLAALMATDGLDAASAASAGALASGAAIVLAPIALAGLATTIDLSWAFLAPLPLLATLLILHQAPRPAAPSRGEENHRREPE
jgi:MFS family permease